MIDEQPDTDGIIERCRKGVGDYLPIAERGFDGFVLRDRRNDFTDLPATLARLDSSDARLCKARKKITAGIVDHHFIKRYNYRGAVNAFRRLFRMPRPYRVLAGAVRLKEFAIPTPEVLLAVRSRRFGLPYHDYLITSELSALQLDCSKLAGEFAEGDAYRQFVAGVTSLLVQLHAAGLEHGDLNLRNIFCRKSPVGVYSGWGVIDLDGCQVYSDEMPESRRRRELARVISSFFRSVKTLRPEVKLDHDNVIAEFTRKYRELSGYNLSGSALDRRVDYLTGRIRKK